MKLPAREKTDRMARGFVLVASIVSRPFRQVAFVIFTVSGAAAGPGLSVTVVVRVTPNHEAVIVTVVCAVTGDVRTGKSAVALPWFTTTSAGTRTSAVLLLRSCTV